MMKLVKLFIKFAKWQKCLFFLLLFIKPYSANSSNSENSLYPFEKKQYASSAVESVAGQSAQMPCNMTVAQNDTVYLVLWFKEGLTTPIYSYDVRELLSGEPKHWWDQDLLGSRAYFNAHSRPAHLLLRHVTPDDAGQYKCRVDFQREPTRNSRVNLTVVVPPRDVVIRDATGNEVRSFIDPRSEGDRLQLSCIAYGGIPPPRLVWLINGKLYDEIIDSSTNGELRNDLIIEKLTRDHLRAQLSCKASYGKAYTPFLSTATLDMNLEPLDVRIHPPAGPLSAGRSHELICSSRGSRPPAILTWWKGGKRIPTVTDQTSPDGNVSRSVIKININASHNGQVFKCKAKNSNMPTAVMEDSLKIDVHYLPVVRVKLGSNLNPSKIKEGDDVYFECTVVANPSVYKIIWKHNGKLVHQNVDSGILLSNRSLVLQNVGRDNSGNYVCVASNVEGDGKSRAFNLKIQYVPLCKSGQNIMYGVSKLENAHVTCQVDAVPQVTKFRWWFNNTAETLEVPEGRFTVGLGGRSVVTYTPTSDLDYGTLLCSAQNNVGEQTVPCIYHIVPATRPETPTNCTVQNVSGNSLGVLCAEGFDGGLNQSFVMEVYTTNPHTLHANLTARRPRFEVSGLESDSEIQLIIYSGNAKGRSGITRIVSFTLKPPVKQLETRVGTGENANQDMDYIFAMPSILGLLVGAIFILIVVIIIIFVSIRHKCWRRRFDREDSSHHSSDCSQTQFTLDTNYHQTEFSNKFSTPANNQLQSSTLKCPHQVSIGNHLQSSGTIMTSTSSTTASSVPILYHQQQQHRSTTSSPQTVIVDPSCMQQMHQNNFPITHDLRDLPPPPCQYASDPIQMGHSGTLRIHQHLTSSDVSSASEVLTLQRNTQRSQQLYDRNITNLQERQHPYPWPSEGPSSAIPIVTSCSSNSRGGDPHVYVSESSSKRHSCGSITAMKTISENREAAGSPASRTESAL